MLGHRILKRITRLGMAFYATLWCMSFTVCAYDDPIADMAVENRIEALAASEDSSITDDASLGASGQEEAVTGSSAEGASTDVIIPDNNTVPGEGSSEEITDPDEKPTVPGDEDDQSGEAASTASSEDAAEESNEEASAEDSIDTEEIDELTNETEELEPIAEELEEKGLVGASLVLYLKYNGADYLFADSVNQTYNLQISKGGEGSFEIENLTYFLSETNITTNEYGEVQHFNLTNTSDTYNGAKITKTEDGNAKISFDSTWKQSECSRFYACVVCPQGYEDWYSVATIPVDVYVTVENLYVRWRYFSSSDLYGIQINNTMNFSVGLFNPYGGELVGDRISWNFTERIYDDKIGNWTNAAVDPGRGISVSQDSENKSMFYVGFTEAYEKFGDFSINFEYNNDHTKNGINVTGPTRRAHFGFNATAPLPETEAHLSETAIKMQVFKNTNLVPITIRTVDQEKSQMINYTLYDVKLLNEELSKYVVAHPDSDEPHTIRIWANSNLTTMNSKDLAAFAKKKFTTGINISAGVGTDSYKEYTVCENLTITFGTALPTTKDIKSANTLEFDSYYQGEDYDYVSLSGIRYFKILPVDLKKLNDLGFNITGSNTIETLPNLPATKKGTINVLVVPLYDDSYNLPSDFNVSVPVKYNITNSAPKLTVDKKSLLMNPATGDDGLLYFELNRSVGSETRIGYTIIDSKKKDVTSQNLFNVTVNFDRDYSYGNVSIVCNENTTFGQSYKLNLYAYNYRNNRTGAISTITVKTVAEKDENNIGVNIKAKGKLDAGIPYDYLCLNCTGKNIDLNNKSVDYVNITLKNGTEITDCFWYGFYPSESAFYIEQLYGFGSYNFPLLERGYAGQQYSVKLGFNLTRGENLTYVTYTGKIANSKITPKFAFASATVNPKYNGNQTIYVPMINKYSWYYNYTVVCDFGKDKAGNPVSSPYNVSFIEDGYNYLVLTPLTNDMSAFAGRSGAIKVTPVIPGGSVGTATFKISFQNPAKAKIAVTGKAKGNINSLKDNTYVNITFTYKNILMVNTTNSNIELDHFVKVVKGKEENCSESLFYGIPEGKYNYIIEQPYLVSVDAGNYKAYFKVYYKAFNGEKYDSVYDVVAVPFKVVRGKPGVTVNPSPIKLVNRDYARTADVNITAKNKGFKVIKNVEITGIYKDKMNITRIGDQTYKVGFTGNYYETSKVKKLWLAITKNVTRSVSINVYYYGSDVPEKGTIKVKINP